MKVILISLFFVVVPSLSFAEDGHVFTDTDLEKYSPDSHKQEYDNVPGYENEKSASLVNKNWMEENDAWCEIHPSKCWLANNWCTKGLSADGDVSLAEWSLQRALDYPEEGEDATHERRELQRAIRERHDLYEEAREAKIPLGWLKCKF